MKFLIPLFLILASFNGYSQTGPALIRAQELYADNRFISVIDLVDSLEHMDNAGPSLCRLRGLSSFQLARYDRALADFEKVLAAQPGNPGILSTIGRTYEQLNRVSEAISVYEQLIELDPQNIGAKVELGDLYRSTGDYDRALSCFLELVALDSTNYYYLKQAGRIYQQLDSINLAIAYDSRAHVQNPRDLILVSYLANLYLKKKDLAGGLRSVNEGLSVDSTYIELRKLRGYLQYLSGDYQAAIDDFLFIDRQDTASVYVNKYLGLSCYKKDTRDLEGAYRYLKRAYELDSTDVETSYFLANTCRYSSRVEDGLFYMEKTINSMMPDSADRKKVYLDLAEINNQLHNFFEAIDYYQRAYLMDKDDYLIYFQVGRIYDEGLENKRQAVGFYNEFLKRARQSDTQQNEQVKTLMDFVEGRIGRLREEMQIQANPGNQGGL